jgi:hypothetical protein
MKTAFVMEIVNEVMRRHGATRDEAMLRVKYHLDEGFFNARPNPKNPGNLAETLVYPYEVKDFLTQHKIPIQYMKDIEILIASVEEEE